MRILAISDASSWDTQAELLRRHRPDVTVLAGDLVSDGSASFWRTGLESIAAYRRERDALHRWHPPRPHPPYRRGVPVPLSRREREFMALQARYLESCAFQSARRRLHVKPFYEFLAEAGRVSQVLVVKGNHDDDFSGDYSRRQIQRVRGCREISGEIVELEGYVILGVGADEAWRIRELKRLITTWRGRVDIVIAHAPRRHIHYVTALRSLEVRLLQRGRGDRGGRRFISEVRRAPTRR